MHTVDISSMHITLSQPRPRWMGHMSRMIDVRTPKDILYCQLVTGKHECPLLHSMYTGAAK
uniref:Uncharacterized protein n=1 Tax=Arion vulgaris TaxID=1028688 RepID=A0A0B7ATF9_9EUPU